MDSAAKPDIDAIKERNRSTWTAGDFGVIAKLGREANEDVVAALDLKPGAKVLDVACGTGNSAIPLAKRGADVTGVDIAENLLEQARQRAQDARVQARFQEGDAERLAFPDNSFDLVISIFGAMFAPRADLVARELQRVCRPGGRIVMGNWTGRGYVGEMFALNARYVPPPPGVSPPLEWGSEDILRQRFGEGMANVQFKRRISMFQLPLNEAQAVEHFLTYFGPTLRTFAALDSAGQDAYRHDLEAAWRRNNLATDGTLKAQSEFLEVIATKA